MQGGGVLEKGDSHLLLTSFWVALHASAWIETNNKLVGARHVVLLHQKARAYWHEATGIMPRRDNRATLSDPRSQNRYDRPYTYDPF